MRFHRSPWTLIGAALAIHAALALPGCDNVDRSTVETIETVHYQLVSQGQDLRVYEWTTPGNLDCVFVAGAQKGGLVCVRGLP